MLAPPNSGKSHIIAAILAIVGRAQDNRGVGAATLACTETWPFDAFYGTQMKTLMVSPEFSEKALKATGKHRSFIQACGGEEICVNAKGKGMLQMVLPPFLGARFPSSKFD
jgi:hypothetical protein